ncbi:MAG: hypothetical protein AAF074_25270 [Pseudomonadota bacterium]
MMTLTRASFARLSVTRPSFARASFARASFARRAARALARRVGHGALLALAIAPFGADSAWARTQTGVLQGVCNIAGQSAPWQMRFTRYGDVVVWTDRHGLNPDVTDMGQWGPTHWEGVIATPYGRYRLTGENAFIEAWLVGGVYSDMVTLQITVTGPRSFTFRDFYNDGRPFPCRITG